MKRFGHNSIIYSTVVAGILLVVAYLLFGAIAALLVLFWYAYNLVMTTTMINVGAHSIVLFPFRQYRYKRIVNKQVIEKIVIYRDKPDFEGRVYDDDHISLATQDDTYRYNLSLHYSEMKELYDVLLSLGYNVELKGTGF